MSIVAAVAVLLLVDFIVFAYDRYVISFVLFIAILVLSALFLAPEVVDVVLAADWKTITFGWIPTFLAIGAGVAFIKWIQHVYKISGKVKGLFDEYRNNLKTNHEVTAAGFVEWLTSSNKYQYSTLPWDDSDRGFVRERLRGLRETIRDRAPTVTTTFEEVAVALAPRAKENTERITFWLLQWPVVVVCIFFEDILFKLGKRLAEIFDGLFSKLSTKIVGGAFTSKD